MRKNSPRGGTDALRRLPESAAEQLIPAPYEAYRAVVRDGFEFFLGRLPPRHRASIVAAQLALPRTASMADRVIVLLRQCPTLHKLGQVIAHDVRLTRELRECLQSLESLAPTTDLGEIMPIVHGEFGDLPDVHVATGALAEGSVAVVVPFTWQDPGARLPTRGVFKVVKPQAEERLLAELELWPALGDVLEERCARYGLPALDYRATLESVRDLLLSEIRLDEEQAHLTQAGELYAASPTIVIPRLLPFCRPRITAMERVDGSKVTDAALGRSERRRLAQTIAEALLAKPFWSTTERARFHADPHAGNLFVTHDGRLAIFDWALVTDLSKTQRAAVVQAILSAMMLDESHLCRSIASLGRVADRASFDTAVIDAVRQVRHGIFPGFVWLMRLLDRVGTSAAVHFPAELALFRKSLLTLSGVVAAVSDAVSLDQVFAETAASQFFAELPGRALLPLDSRGFGSHVSTADLMKAWAALPAVPARYWNQTWRDVLEGTARS
jgi:ubiquinone biosynthesis protein